MTRDERAFLVGVMSPDQLRALVCRIHNALFLEFIPETETFELVADKEWSADTLEEIGAAVREAGLWVGT